jgi:iron complex outermembrane receptor protein
LPNGAVAHLNVSYTHTSEIYNDVQDTWLLRRPPEDMIDAYSSYVWPNGKMTLTVGGTNLTDRRYITTGQVNDAAGDVYGTYNAPREWFATLRARY